MRGARLRRLRAHSLALASLNINGELARRLNNDTPYASALILSGPPFVKSVVTALILSIFKQKKSFTFCKYFLLTASTALLQL